LKLDNRATSEVLHLFWRKGAVTSSGSKCYCFGEFKSDCVWHLLFTEEFHLKYPGNLVWILADKIIDI